MLYRAIDKAWIAYEVSLPQPPRVGTKPVNPLEARIVNRARRFLDGACKEIEGRADGYNRPPRHISEPRHYVVLTGRTQPNPDNGCINVPDAVGELAQCLVRGFSEWRRLATSN